MVNLPYSRELSLLLCFERDGKGDLHIRVFYNGETLVETLRYKMGRPFSLKTLSYCAYQGVLYVCFGLNHPLYRFKVDEDALGVFNGEINKIYAEKQKEIDERDEFIEKHKHDFRAVQDESIFGKDVTAYHCHAQVVEQVKLENPETLKTLFAFEALAWPVTSYTPQHLTELLQVDAEQVNETLEKASEEEQDKVPMLFRVEAIAPFASRLWGFGSPTNSHRITASAKGDFSDFDVAYPSLVQARNPLSPIIGTFISETFDPVLWAVPFGEELLVGTTDGIYVLKEGQRDKGEFIKIHKELHLGVAPIKPVVLDKALYFVEGNRKNISCLTWSRERGGYQVHSLNAYADHLFASGVVRLEAVRTPFNMLFVLLGDGHFNIFTHDADLKILGWTQHYLGGDARIVDCCALPTLKDDAVFFWVARDGIEYLEVLKTGQISSHHAPRLRGGKLIHEATYLDCSSRCQDKTEITIDRAVQSLIDGNQFFEEVDYVPQGYALLSKRLHHQVDRDAEQFDIKDFLINGVPWEELASGVFVQGTMDGDRFIPDDPVEDEAVADLLDAAPFIKGSLKDGLFVENRPLDAGADDGGLPDDDEVEGRPPGRLQYLYGKLVGADPLKGESKKFLERYFKIARKAILKDIGRWGAFLEGLQGLIRLPQDMSIQNFNFPKVCKKVDQLHEVLEAIRRDPNRRVWDNLFYLDYRDFVVTHKTKPYINFHSRKELLRLRETAIDEFHALLDQFLRLFKPFLDNIGLRNDFATVQAFVTHINKCFLEFMAGFEGGNFFEQIHWLQHPKNFWHHAFQFDLTSRAIFATKEIIEWLKDKAEDGVYKGTPFDDLDTERKVLFLKGELSQLLEEREAHVKIRPQTQFVPRNMNIAFMDKTQIILDVCASLGVDINFGEAADILSCPVQDGNITPALRRRRRAEADDEAQGDIFDYVGQISQQMQTMHDSALAEITRQPDVDNFDYWGLEQLEAVYALALDGMAWIWHNSPFAGDGDAISEESSAWLRTQADKVFKQFKDGMREYDQGRKRALKKTWGGISGDADIFGTGVPDTSTSCTRPSNTSVSGESVSNTSVSYDSVDEEEDEDEALNRAIEGGDPEVISNDAKGNKKRGLQQDYNNLTLQLYTRMNTVRNYIERHYLLLSDQGNSNQALNLWAEQNTYLFFKYCFLDLKNMSLYQDLFKNVSLETYTDLVNADSTERTVFTIPALQLFPADKLTLVADNGFYEHPFTIKGDQVKLTKPIKAFSIGFNYASSLKLFPLMFAEEADPIPKRNVNLGLKVYNTKDGWVEEHQEDGSTVMHSLRSSLLPHNHRGSTLDFNNHMSDRGYLVKEVAAILVPPYQSGWLEIPMKEAIKRDICVSITVNTPAPFTLLRVSAKAQLLEHYKV